MLGLTLRKEFLGKRLRGTAIELSKDTNTGVTQIAASAFLEITHPIHDRLKSIEAVGPNQGRPVVVIGERGLGKSRLMAALYHAATNAVSWNCAAPRGQRQIDFGRILGGEARDYPQEILLRDSGKPAGLFHLRIT